MRDYFYFVMSLVIATIVVYGFSQTAKEKFIHPTIARPFVLYVHAVVFSGWALFLIFQSALVRTGIVQWHRRIGWIGAGAGIAVLVVGVETAITRSVPRSVVIASRAVWSFRFVVTRPSHDVAGAPAWRPLPKAR